MEVIGWAVWAAALAPVLGEPFLERLVNTAPMSRGLADAAELILPRDAAIWVMFACGLLASAAVIALGRRFDRHLPAH